MVANVPLPWLGGEQPEGSSSGPYGVVRASVMRMVRLRGVRLAELGVTFDDLTHETLASMANSQSPYVHGTSVPHPKYFEVTAFRFVLSLARRRRFFHVDWNAAGADRDFEIAGGAAARGAPAEPVGSSSTLSIVLARERELEFEQWRRFLPSECKLVLDLLEEGHGITAIAKLIHVARSRVKRTRAKIRQSASKHLRIGPFSRAGHRDRFAPESLN